MSSIEEGRLHQTIFRGSKFSGDELSDLEQETRGHSNDPRIVVIAKVIIRTCRSIGAFGLEAALRWCSARFSFWTDRVGVTGRPVPAQSGPVLARPSLVQHLKCGREAEVWCGCKIGFGSQLKLTFSRGLAEPQKGRGRTPRCR